MDATQYGLSGVVALMILKEVFSFVKSKRNGHSPNKALSEAAIKAEIYRQGRIADEAHDAHLGPRAISPGGELRWYGTSAEVQTTRHAEIVGTLNNLVIVNEQIRDAIKANGHNKK